MAKTFKAVAEGDSWFNLPNLPIGLPIVGGVDGDAIRALEKRGHIFVNIAHFGDTLTSIAEAKDYLGAFQSGSYDAFLLCGSGNDLLGGGQLYKYLNLYQSSRPNKEYLKASFYSKIAYMEMLYAEIIESASELPEAGKLQIVSHGYDYAIPQKRGYWLGEPMKRQGIDNPELQKDLVKLMIDELYSMLKRISRRYKNFHYVDLRGVVAGRWHDELHPKKKAFADIAKKLEKKVLKVI